MFGALAGSILSIFVATKSVSQGFPLSYPEVLASRSFSLNDRYNNEFVNTVFKKNILLTLA